MSSSLSRRDFVATTLKAGAAAGLADFAFLRQLGPLSAAEVQAKPGVVELSPDIEPLVKLIEETRRDKLIEAAVAKIRTGTTYQQFLSAVMLAGVRGIKPRPVGFKFHAVLVVNSAHLATLASPDSDRWLPMLWALDNFKVSQETNQKEGGWMMPPVDEAKVPSATQARQRFVETMDNWDVDGADSAIAGLVRAAGAGEVIELFWRYGARDFRDIGHKAIYVANSWRTLQTIGWRHAEPIMRSLAFALLEHEGTNPARRDADADRPWRENQKRAAKIRGDWLLGKPDRAAAVKVLEVLRKGTPAECCEQVVELINKGVHPSSVWDGLFLGAGEFLMRQPGIVGLHCVTSANALHQGYQLTGSDETRRLLLLQTAAFLALFRGAMLSRGKLADLKIDALEPADIKAEGAAAVAEILADVSSDRLLAARKTLDCLGCKGASVEDLLTAARRLLFNKGNNSHDYKFASAALEDYYHVSPAWRNHFLATSMFNLRGSGDRDNDLIKRARETLA